MHPWGSDVVKILVVVIVVADCVVILWVVGLFEMVVDVVSGFDPASVILSEPKLGLHTAQRQIPSGKFFENDFFESFPS